MSSSLLLTAYPLPREFIENRCSSLRGTKQLALTELRELGPVGLLSRLRSLEPDRLILPIEDEKGSALLPITKLIAAMTRARSIEMLHADGVIAPISRAAIIGDGFRFGFASLNNLLEALRSWLELKGIMSEPRYEIAPQEGKILYLRTNLWFGVKAGGSIGHIAGVVNGLQRGGHEVIFVSGEAPVMCDDDVVFHKVEPPRTYGLPYELNNYRFQRRFISVAAGIFACEKISFIYQRLSAANYIGALLARAHRVPLVVEYNGSEVWIAKHWGRGMVFPRLAHAAEEAMLRHAHVIVTISDVLRDELIERGIEPSRIVTYPNCVDERVFNPASFSKEQRNALRARYGIANDATVCTFIGTFGQWHGVDVLARVIVQIRQRYPELVAAKKLHFMLVGDGLKMKEVREIISRGGASDICTVTGLVPQPQAPLYLAASDILVSPHVANSDGSRFFGSPTKLFEYMAMRKPIIASALEQIGEVLSPGLAASDLDAAARPTPDTPPYLAVLTEPGNEEQVVQALRFIVQRPDWAEYLAANSHREAMTRYTWQHHVERILQRVFER